MSSQTFRFRITAFAVASLTIDERAVSYQRSLYRARVPLGNIRLMALRRRRRGFFGMVASELVLLTEPLPGVKRVLRWTLDADSPEGQAAMARLREVLPAELDASKRTWRQAAGLLGTKPLTARDVVMSRWGQAGTGALGAALGMLVLDRVSKRAVAPGAQQIQLWVDLGLAVLGVVLLVLGAVQARRELDVTPQ